MQASNEGFGRDAQKAPERPFWLDTVQHRLLGFHDSIEQGPTILVIACLHGNEFAGCDAVMRVHQSLQRGAVPFRGTWMAVLGNVPAYNARKRLIDEDLNRIWTRENVDFIRMDGPKSVEQEQLFELTRLFDFLGFPVVTEDYYLLDLHTTSAASEPFIAHAGNGRARTIVENIGAIEVRRVTEYLDGMLVNYTSELGWASLAFEAGSHRQAESVNIHEKMIWQAMATAGMIEWEHIPQRIRSREVVTQSSRKGNLPVEVIHHHLVRAGDDFRMRPGYANFQHVDEGEVLAEDRNGPITSPASGRIFLPLYQTQGRDGFFIVRDVF